MKTIEYLFADLDGTLIETISGATFPLGVWDMKLKFDVLDKIKEQQPKCVFIISNQGGIEKGFVNQSAFISKIEYVKYSIEEYCGIPISYEYCPYNDKDNKDRKPNVGMLERICRICKLKDKSRMLMIGDASGLKGQFSDSDKQTATNFGIEYYDVYEFLRL